MQRFVIFPNEIHVSHSMRTLLRKNLYRFSINEDFEGVIHNCSKADGRFDMKHLARFMSEHGGSIIDCQFETPHLRSMGGRFIPYEEYMKLVLGV